jgi:hypothetical protein
MSLAAINLLDPFNWTLLTIVAVFWALVIRKAMALQKKWFPNLLIIPLFFFGVGVLLNAAKPGLGTYVIGGLHLLLLILLAANLTARRRRP